MFEKLARLFGASAPVSSQEIEAAIADIDVDALRATHDAIAAERQALLLTGTNDQVVAAENRATAARLDVDRAEAALNELRSRLAVAKQDETEQAYFAAHGAAVSARAAWVVRFSRELPKIEKTLTDLFEESEDIARQIRDVALLRRPHDFTGDKVDLSPTVPMPGEEFKKEQPFASWLVGLMQRHVSVL